MLPRAGAGALCALPLLLQFLTVNAAAAVPSPFADAMRSAARARHVPLELIEATAYVNTRWEWISTPALDRGLGPMNVKPDQMALAASLSGRSESAISGDLASNLDAGAALLAHYHTSGTDLASWQAAVSATQGPFVAGEVYRELRSGASRTTGSGETITLAPQTVSATGITGGAAGVDIGSATTASCAATSPDFGAPACWIPADASNYSIANRTHDYPIDMIIIHDIEGSYGSAIQVFQTPGFAASAHYVVSYGGDVTQMVREKDIAWHAGNWDYNTRAIGIEHEGFAWTPGLYTTAEYNASAQIAASICSRYGVVLDRTHVIGHNEVPDPNNPGLFGGSDHHTDPGPYWNWTYYMQQAQSDARTLPSLPHLMPDPIATAGTSTATVSWLPARTCRPADAPITGYTVVMQPGGVTRNLPASATSATFTGLQVETNYSFTVTATNAQGQDTRTSNTVMTGSCTSVGYTTAPGSPQLSGTTVTVTANTGGCPNPLYEFWVVPPGATSTRLAQAYSSSPTLSWNTNGLGAGGYRFSIWARDARSSGVTGNSSGTWDAYNNNLVYTLTASPCSSVNVSASPAAPRAPGTAVMLTASSPGCPSPQFRFAVLAPGSGSYQQVQAYSSSASFAWNTAGLAYGSYRFSVWARDASSVGLSGNASGRWDAYNNNLVYSLAVSPCAAVNVTAAPASPSNVGTQVTLNARAAGCPQPLYRFAVLAPGAPSYQMVEAYSSSGTYAWSTVGAIPGTYRFSVWAKDASSGGTSGNADGRWDAYNNGTTYSLSSCTVVAVTVTPASPARSGTKVTVTAIATGCSNPVYRFSLLAPGGTSYQLAQGYSSSGSFTWDTTSLPAGSYRFSVWAKDANSGGVYGNSAGRWDTYNNNTVFTLT